MRHLVLSAAKPVYFDLGLEPPNPPSYERGKAKEEREKKKKSVKFDKKSYILYIISLGNFKMF